MTTRWECGRDVGSGAIAPSFCYTDQTYAHTFDAEESMSVRGGLSRVNRGGRGIKGEKGGNHSLNSHRERVSHHIAIVVISQMVGRHHDLARHHPLLLTALQQRVGVLCETNQLRSTPVADRFGDAFIKLRKVQNGIHHSRGGHSSDHKGRVGLSEPRGQSARVAATESNPRQPRTLPNALHSRILSVGQPLRGRPWLRHDRPIRAHQVRIDQL
mmetsp:Transcript_25162/g.44870  ORF Transcript_25162/g.44870 Transcript_25162/m.44870 type:complete len:214 (-) Transcript_25162:524-1165(-)